MFLTIDWKKFKITQIIIGIIQVVLAIWIFRNPTNVSKWIAILAGILLLFKGIIIIYIRNFVNEHFNIRPNGMILMGVLDIILAIIIFFNVDTSSRFIFYAIVFYILFRSFTGLFTLSPMRLLIPSYHMMSTVVSILGVIIALQSFIFPQLALYSWAFSIAIYMLIEGIQHIVFGFLDL